MKLLRVIIVILFLIILVGVLAIAAMMVFIDPNKLKTTITEEVKKQTGYQVVIDGKLSWSFYPSLGVKIEHMTLQAPDSSFPFADFSNVKMASKFSEFVRDRKALQGKIYIDEVKLFNLHVQKVQVNLQWQNDVLTLNPIKASLYEGALEGNAHGRDFSSSPKWDWDMQAREVQLKPLLEDVNGSDNKVKLAGLSEVRLQAATEGKNRDQLLRNLNGTCAFSLSQGTIHGVDLNYLVQSADALLNKQPISAPSMFNQTAFDSLVGSAIIKNGVATNNNLVLISPAFTAKGAGDIDLVAQTINYQLQVSPLYTTKLKGNIPVLITGELTQPTVRLDPAGLNAIITKEQIEKVKTKVKEQIKQLPDKADKFLQHILGQ